MIVSKKFRITGEWALLAVQENEKRRHLLYASAALVRYRKKPHAVRVEEKRALARSIKTPPDRIESKPASLRKNQEVFLCQTTIRV